MKGLSGEQQLTRHGYKPWFALVCVKGLSGEQQLNRHGYKPQRVRSSRVRSGFTHDYKCLYRINSKTLSCFRGDVTGDAVLQKVDMRLESDEFFHVVESLSSLSGSARSIAGFESVCKSG